MNYLTYYCMCRELCLQRCINVLYTVSLSDILEFINTKNLQRTEIVSQPLPTSSPAPAQIVPPQSPASDTTDDDGVAVNIPMSNMRKIIAKRLTESKVAKNGAEIKFMLLNINSFCSWGRGYSTAVIR